MVLVGVYVKSAVNDGKDFIVISERIKCICCRQGRIEAFNVITSTVRCIINLMSLILE